MDTKENIEIEKKNSFLLIKINGHYLSSRYNPEKEAIRSFEKIKEKNVYIFFGIGSGYLFNLIYNSNNFKQKKIFIIEKNNDLICLLKKEFCFDFNFSNIILINEISELNKVLVYFEFEDLFSFEIIKNQVETEILYKDFFNEIEKKFFWYINEIKQNFLTKLILEKEWNKNSIINFKEIINANSINFLVNKFKNVPGILISAGPSLDKNINELKDYVDKCVIVAVDTALKTCKLQNIKPDFIYSLDCNRANFSDFLNVQTDELNLIFDFVVYPDIITNFRGRKFFSITGHEKIINNNYFVEYIEFYNWLKSFLNFDLPYIQTGGSVAHSAFDFLRICGCNPIILIGQDLAYSNFKHHTITKLNYEGINKFFTLETEFFNISLNKNLLKIKGYYDEFVFTDSVLYGYLKWFEDAGEKLNKFIELINSTEGGAEIKNFQKIRLSDALKKYCKNTLDKNFINNSNDNIFKENKNLILDKIIEKINEFELVREKCLTFMKKIEENYKNKIVLNKDEINAAEKNILETEKFFIKIFLKDYKYRLLALKMNKNISENEYNYLSAVIFFKLMIEAVDYFQPLFQNLYNKLK